ncbi:hypothetical protein FDB55_04440 [Clostridium botulinum]|uniref:Uncharacterized protein n=1 Tax=Clostridium botulinum TaxID=1491 RepID=A0A6B4QPX7_CLOBO|nr:hypothetical protein [Clostridium botulinum]MBN1075259.1 hypothetical protein [Clostridium botulinum]MBY6810661.1 hypothetical protein [Clostridium botulinum]MBY6824117.1 hypothetical protein [Clostridium botulinum]MBY6833158.1 hypothetical protein [Clostridium botulinum]MBY6971219.1 hypothetical protein [Clostridium botulinum]
MAKHKRKERQPVDNNVGSNNFRANNNNNNPFGIDPTQLMGMLGGNFDINSLLASMNIDGLNLANLAPLANMAGINLGNFGNSNQMNNMNNMNNMNPMNGDSNINNMNDITNDFTNTSNDIMQDFMNTSNNMNFQENNVNEKKSKKTSSHRKKEIEEEDGNLEMLISLRGFVHPEKVDFIDKIIDLYKTGAFKDI